MDIWEKLSFHKNKIFAILLVLVVFYWISIPEEDDDPYIIYIEYDCRKVYKDSTDIPKEVIEECRKVFEEHHGSKTSNDRA
jgi:hypothetical protein